MLDWVRHERNNAGWNEQEGAQHDSEEECVIAAAMLFLSQMMDGLRDQSIHQSWIVTAARGLKGALEGIHLLPSSTNIFHFTLLLAFIHRFPRLYKHPALFTFDSTFRHSCTATTSSVKLIYISPPPEFSEQLERSIPLDSSSGTVTRLL